MTAHDFNKQQSILMIFIYSNTTRLAPFPLWRYVRTKISNGVARARNDCAG